jgi:uncharacterized protein (DUF2062 family)
LNRIKAIFYQQISQGVSPKELALSCSLALVFGIFPLLGTTTVLCLLAGLYFRLNQPVLQTLNYLFSPLQLIGIPLFLYLGESALGLPHLVLNPLEIPGQFASDWRLFLSQYGMAGVHAILAWAIIAPILGMVTYYFSKKIFDQMKGLKK